MVIKKVASTKGLVGVILATETLRSRVVDVKDGPTIVLAVAVRVRDSILLEELSKILTVKDWPEIEAEGLVIPNTSSCMFWPGIKAAN